MKKFARGALTATGVDSQLMKSALQKWIRRGDPKAIQAAIELWRLAEIGALGLQTNVLNRVMVIALEDVGVGPGDLRLASLVLETLQKKRTERMGAELAVLVQRLLSSPKNRLCSLLYNCYATERGRKLAQADGITFSFTQSSAVASFELAPRDWVAEAKLATALDLFGASLQAKSGEAVYWADCFIKLTMTGGVGRLLRGTGKAEQKTPMNLFWDRMERAGQLRQGTLDLYKKTFWLRREAQDVRVFWLAPLVGILIGLTESEFEPDRLEGVEEMQASQEFQQLFVQPKPMELEPFVYDWHTRQGKKAGATKYDFAVENSLVQPEHFPPLPEGLPSVEQLKRLYVAVKAEETKEDPVQWKKVSAPKRKKIEQLIN